MAVEFVFQSYGRVDMACFVGHICEIPVELNLLLFKERGSETKSETGQQEIGLRFRC